jgi:hypothetical protein
MAIVQRKEGCFAEVMIHVPDPGFTDGNHATAKLPGMTPQ